MSLPSAARAAIDELLQRQRELLNIPGIGLAVTDGERLLYEQSYGYADVAAGSPVTAATMFEIGSISKSFTAALVVGDALAGELDLHAPITDYVPWFSVRAQHQHPITAHHLLQHSAGLIAGAEATTEARSEVWALRETDAIAEPGTWFHYSNVGYKLLGILLEGNHRRSYGELLQARILDPLGLERTSPLITNAVRELMATGYEPFYDDRPAMPGAKLAPATWLETGTADGSIVSTAAEMAAYLRSWMKPGELFSDELLAAMTTNTIPTDDGIPDSRYGYGWQLGTVDGHRRMGHGGGMVGYRSYVLSDLDAQLAVVILTNGPWRSEETAHRLLSIVRDACEGGEPTASPAAELDAAQIPATREPAGGAERAATEADDVLTCHWRAHNPWLTNFRTLRRGEQLLLVVPGGVESPGDETPLVAIGEHRYRLGTDPRSPEQLSFSMFIDGRPHEANLSGCAYHRTFTP
jgi:CubicO group peptidase (beta-lactamase class C family)